MTQRLIPIMILGLFTVTAHAQPFEVDFSQQADPPLVKTKFGVYQTPLTTLPRLLDSVPLLREINVSDLRYELGWGKPESLASAQISGTAQQLVFDFSTIDTFMERLKEVDVTPLLAMTYCPNPLKSRTGWPAWKDLPVNLGSWQKINHDYAFHLRSKDGLEGPCYEIWNEPDIPDPGGKMFFTGTPQDYEQLYAHAAEGIRQGAPDALIGGPAAAWDLAYLKPILTHPIDFASIHGYNNYPAQLDMMRGAVAGRPELPIFLTEYASFTDFPANGPQSRYQAAMRFFRDVKGLLNYTDVAKVYWAQWLDAGNSPGMGLVTWDGHRKSIFNAFKIYGAMPVDRNSVKPDGAEGIDLMASSDEHSAAVVLWNTSTGDRSVTVNFNHLPFSSGVLQLYRIDREHASYIDNPASENLEVLQSIPLKGTAARSWSGVVPAEGVVYLKASDDTPPASPLNSRPGTYVRSHQWFFDRHSNAYADFDPRTWTARLGMGDSDSAVAQVGSVIDHPTPRLRVQVTRSGPFVKQDRNSLFGLRIDFQSGAESYSRSVLYHNGLYSVDRDSRMPWGKGGATPDHAAFENAMNTGQPFEINLAHIAPADWNFKRIIITFLMQNAGRGSRAKFSLTGL